MKRAALAVTLLLGAAMASAQVYKWKDEKGVTHYSDMPPPSSVKKVEIKNLDGSGSGVELPYAVAEAMRSSPVTLYTTSKCQACDDGRRLLNERGIPFSEKTVSNNEDIEKLKQAGSEGQLPLLLVGRARLVGFEANAWNEALSNANYPSSRLLPAGYKAPAAEPAAPPRLSETDQIAQKLAADKAAAEKAAAERAKAPPPPKNAPPGFVF
ncbi:glutaredoxin family protein [Massilia sp. TS11]|uniref:glutaredoxin family protein n=1 Tax=Massilia sp. TS11 TaxID=2908003 RepID=UPI001EDB7177|nr:glutaredoxin family protein [Massilia sp. TS11]MCG2583802.1 glutaredoxin family protein [Massilia sp. TS11]